MVRTPKWFLNLIDRWLDPVVVEAEPKRKTLTKQEQFQKKEIKKRL